ncbi:4-phytase [Actinoplanes sp. SE50]|uniref:peptide ABC transporter substrate-binding protein n=1 Tax=unclassified Actinoplanes TaxID=2626549 RepID=UPI00023EBCB0|nr:MULTISPECIES: ABC transporter substrate-binding protein [unclassified Actinoplanes]AEV81779.1 peptide/nickel transport system substrate-binding protein [Actinoplanes sp. SE50/110]ATO80180.1 4-phytase [Actinoplanes sp. SE50]SLL97584.1 ABC-type peptide/nickel transporter, substrate-binding lipoprotein [Actinoplanes sp. SE50/110]
MPGKSPWKMAVGATAIALLAAGCGGGGSDDQSTTSNTVVIGISEPEHLIPSNTTDSSGSEVLQSLFTPLVKFDDKNEPTLVAAESITPDKTNTTWTVKLKSGYTFSNGEPVTSDNYINAWNYGAYGPNGQNASSFFQHIAGYGDLQSVDPDGAGPKKAPDPKAKTLTGLKKVDDSTFTITLDAPFAGWETVMAYDCFLPLPKAAWASEGKLADGFEDALIGNGPFKLKGKWEHDSQLVVEKVADYKGAVPKIDGITWKVYQDLNAEYADLTDGHVDVQTTIPIESLAKASADLGDRFKKSPMSGFGYIGFPTFEKEFSDVRVRQALSMAINRQEISDQIFLGSRVPATSFVSPVVPGYRDNTCGENCTYNPTKAKELYTAANGPKDIKITYNADGGHKPWIDALCNQIKASLGVNCTGVGEPKFADLLKKAEAKTPIGLIRLGWVMDYPLMEDYLGPLYSTGGSSNYYGYSNPTFDNLVKEGSAAPTTDDAVKKWQAAEDILGKDLPVMPIYTQQNVFGHSEKVSNVNVDLYSRVDLSKIEVVK